MKKRRIRWNDELDEYVFRKRSAGEPLRFIGTVINCSPEAVNQRFSRLCKWRGVQKVDRRKVRT